MSGPLPTLAETTANEDTESAQHPSPRPSPQRGEGDSTPEVEVEVEVAYGATSLRPPAPGSTFSTFPLSLV